MPIPKKENPLDCQICIRFTQTEYDTIKAVPNYREKLRELIRQWLTSLEDNGRADG